MIKKFGHGKQLHDNQVPGKKKLVGKYLSNDEIFSYLQNDPDNEFEKKFTLQKSWEKKNVAMGNYSSTVYVGRKMCNFVKNISKPAPPLCIKLYMIPSK